MKKFILSILCAAVFFVGAGGLFETVGAKFKSDEKALTLIKQAREAIGGDANINNIRSLTAVGKVTKNFDFDGAAKIEQGDWELNLQLPNQIIKTMKLRREDGGENGARQEFVQKNLVVVTNDKDGATDKTVMLPEDGKGENKVFIIKKADGETTTVNADSANSEIKKVIVNKDAQVVGDAAKLNQNELFKTTLALLLTVPEGADVSYTYAGDGTVDGNSCDVVDASTGGAAVKLYLDKSTHLPRMISFQGMKPLIFKFDKQGAAASGDKQENVFVRTMNAPETAEFQIKFSDYRTVNGVQMPYKWTQTVGGNQDETIDVASYEINPANIAEKFNREPQKIMIRTKKPQ